ncbi:MAG TPA: hypothetical protein VFH58_13460 [Acidimicrobiales bacterium]|nr:hypothetical protein [Acidimicrobiales bacterium]
MAAFLALLPDARPASADTTQTNGCASVTPGITQLSVPITATASPNPVSTPNKVTLSNTSVTISVDSTLIGAGVATGLVSAADNLADLGVKDNTGAANQSAGINQVVSNAGQVTLMITGSNTSEGTQTASNPAAVNVTFYATADNLGSNVSVYTAVSNPPTLGGPNTADPARTGTKLTGNLSVPINLGNTTWTPSGAGSISFTEKSVTPSSVSTPTTADKSAAPLIVLMKIDGHINVGFWCWTGTQSPAPPAAGTSLVPAAGAAIASVTVNGTTTTTSSTTSSSSTSSTSSSSTTSSSTSSTSTTSSSTTSTTTGSTTTTQGTGTTSTTADGSGGGGGSPATVTSSSHTYSASCTNNLQPGTTQLPFTLKGTVPSQVTAGSTVTITNQVWSVTVPGALLTTGVNLGLLNPGQTVQGLVTPVLTAHNASPGTATASPVAAAFGPIQVDATTGQAADAASAFSVPNMSFTATGGTITFAMAKTVVNVTLGAVKVVFTCDPGASAASFLSTSVVGRAPGQTAVLGETLTPASTTATTADPGRSLAFTGPPRALARLLLLGLICLDLGYLTWTAARPSRSGSRL